jgi:viologen exporter family transport system permease protein
VSAVTVSGRRSPAAPWWRVWAAGRLTAVTAFGQWDQLASELVMLVSQLLLTWWLWRALYAGKAAVGGLTGQQAVTYALLGVLYMRLRAVRWSNGDQVALMMMEGTVAFLFLRPVSPARYHVIRAAGELGYGGIWAGGGYAACLALGAVTGPVSAAAGAGAAASMAFGLVITYLLQLIVDLTCFWTIMNVSAVTATQFLSNLLSGAFAPVFFFPGWFQRLDGLLPFQGALGVPLSLYVGRVPVTALGPELAVQAVWCAVLAAAGALMWRGASRRVTVLGG